MKTQFICKGCGIKTPAASYTDIINRQKLCDDCISANNVAKRARTKPKKYKKA